MTTKHKCFSYAIRKLNWHSKWNNTFFSSQAENSRMDMIVHSQAVDEKHEERLAELAEERARKVEEREAKEQRAEMRRRKLEQQRREKMEGLRERIRNREERILGEQEQVGK